MDAVSGREPGHGAAGASRATSVSVRGELVVRRAGTIVPLRPKERSVLAAIALAHPKPIDADRIVALVWGDEAPPTARKAMQNHVARIRRAIAGLVETSAQGYRFAADVRIDHLSAGDLDVPLVDLADTPEVAAGRERIRAVVVAADEQAWSAELEAGPSPDLVARLHAAATAEPYRERRWQMLAAAHAALGARRDALQACSRARHHLAEVGLVPGPALRKLERELLADVTDDAPLPPDDPSSTVVHPHRHEPFVGRALELTRLADAWRLAGETSRPQLVVVHGVAGSGKTRLVDEFCRTLPDDTVVLLVRHRPDAEQAMAPIAEAIRTVPATSTSSDPSRTLVESVRSTLLRLGDRPHVVVLDDVQWASADEIDVVRRAIDGIATPTTIVVTARPRTPGADRWLPLTAVAALHHLTLGELTRTELGELVDAAGLDAPPDPDLVYARTTGLPFYASELLRVARLMGSLDLLVVPAAIRTWMRSRLASLDAHDAELVHLAAVAGPMIDPDLLARVTGRSLDDLAACCDRLVEAGLLSADLRTGTLRFGHELTRDAITDCLGPATSATLHRQVADALEATGSFEPALLAYHLARSGPSVAERAAAAATQAGLRDLASGAWHRAESWFRTAIELTTDGVERARALAGLGRALVGSERFGESEAALREAIDLSREHGLPAVQASATLALAGRGGRGAGVATADAEITSLLRSALDHLERSPHGSGEQQMLIGAVERELAIMLLLEDAGDERIRLLEQQLARARELDPPDDGELAAALLAARYAKLDGPSLTARLANLDEVLALPPGHVGSERLLTAHCYRHEDLLRSGDRARAAAALCDAEGLVRRYPHPYWNWATRTWQVLQRVVAGDLDGAEQAAFEAAALRPGIPEAAACLGVNLVNVRLYQGRAGEVLSLLAEAVAAHPHIPTYRAVLALCAADSGESAAAGEHLRYFTSTGLGNLPDDTNRLLAMAVLAHAAAEIGDVDAAPVLRSGLSPYAGQWVVLNCYGGGGAVWGPVDHALARLELLDGDPAAASDWFDRAEGQSAGAPLVLQRIRDDRSPAARTVDPTRRRRPAVRAAS